MGIPGLTILEQAVLDKLLAGEDPLLRVLREQTARARLAERTATGVGFYCHLILPDDFIEVASPRDFEIADVKADIVGLQDGAEFVLFVRDGRLAWLEGFTIGEDWPTEITDFQLKYRAEPRVVPTVFPSVPEADQHH